ncbi:MAG: glycosyltransferase family 4 protein [Patescibacteria group bacterium]|nr:glycosyltransferase family 4 protein [Patescibacteria group bacterium]
MKIAVDLRSLSSGYVSGVENYILNLLDQMLKLDKTNSYLLFYNAFQRKSLGDFHYVNSQIINSRYPNKLLNLGLKTGLVSFEKLVGEFDVLFMPNPNQFYIKGKARLVVTAHDLSPLVTPEYYDLKRRLWHRFLNYKKIFERADAIAAVSDYTKYDLVRLLGIKTDKINTIHPGVNSKLFSPDQPVSELRQVRNQYGLPGDYILFLNTLEPRKNLINLLKAFEMLDQDIFLVIAGKPGWKYRGLMRKIRQSKKHHRIRMLGYIPEKHKPAIITMSKFLVYPSFYEGFGFQPLEAAACGRPSVISSVSSLPEVLGEASLLVNPHSAHELLKAFRLLLTDAPLAQSLAEKARQKALAYTWEDAAKKTLELITRN